MCPTVIGVSDYNKIMYMQGGKGVDLGDNGFIIDANKGESIKHLNNYILTCPILTVSASI